MAFARILKSVALAAALLSPLAAAAQHPAPELNIIPVPKRVWLFEGDFKVTDDTRIFLPQGIERPEFLAAQKLQSLLSEGREREVPLDRLGKRGETGPHIYLEIGEAGANDELTLQGYRLRIAEDSIQLVGNSAEGLFNGLQTLIQLARRDPAALPAVRIEDEPDFPNRGFYHDITRGAVPTLETLKEMADQLAEWKVNEFQLYVEHTYMFRFDPEIAHIPDGLTSTEVLELDAYCRDRRIDLVPSLASFGHMGGVLSLDRYRHLAEVETEKNWEDMVWHERMRGLTLDTTNEESWELLAKMFDEYLPLHTSGFFNVCADETYDVGKGKGAARAEELGSAGHLYLEHMTRLNEQVKGYGKRMMFWGDIVKKHPDLIPQIPKDTILLNWGYGQNADFESSKLFADAGLDFYVCPGTSGWNRLINGINNADLNIRRYAEAGKKYGAIGLLNTNWGDYGHINTLGASLHGMALGAAMGWNVGHPDSPEFDRIWNLQTFGTEDGKAIAALRRVAAASNDGDTWVMLQRDWENMERYDFWTKEKAEEMMEASQELARVLREYQTAEQGDERVLNELIWSAEMSELAGLKGWIMADLKEEGGTLSETGKYRAGILARRLREQAAAYDDIWLARNKQSDLKKVLEAIENQAKIADERGGPTT